MSDQTDINFRYTGTDNLSSVVETIRAAHRALKEEQESGTKATQGFGSALEGLIQRADGLPPTLEDIRALAAQLNIQLDEVGQGASTAATGLDELEGSAGSATGSVTDLGDAAGSAAPQVEQAADAVQQVGDKSQATTPQVEGLKSAVDGLEQVAGRAGVSFGGLSDILSGDVAAFGAVAAAIAGVTQAAMEEEVGRVRLTATLQANIPAWDGNTDAIERVITARQELAFSDDQLRSSLDVLVPITHDVSEAFRIQSVAMDLARAKSMDLDAASELLVRGMLNGGTAFRRMGVDIEKGASAMEVLQAVEAKFSGQAAAYADTTQGSFDRLATSTGNLAENMGAPLLSPLERVVDGLARLTDNANEAGGAVESHHTIWGQLRQDMEDGSIATYSHADALVTLGQAGSFDSLLNNLGLLLDAETGLKLAFEGDAQAYLDWAAGIETATSDAADAAEDGSARTTEAVQTTQVDAQAALDTMSQDFYQAAEDMTASGEQGGEGFGTGTVGGITGYLGAISAAASNAVAATDKSGASAGVGAKVGSAYSTNMIAKVDAGIAAAQAKIDAFAAAANAAVPGLNLPKVGRGIAGAGVGGAAEVAWVANAEQMTDAHDRAAGRNAPSEIEQEQNLRKLEEEFEKKYGIDPGSGAPIKAKGGGGGKGKKGGKGAGRTGGGAAGADAKRATSDLNRAESEIERAQRQLEDIENTKLQTSAKDELAAAQEHLNDTQDAYKARLEDLQNEYERVKDSEKGVTAPLIGAIDDAKSRYDALRESHQEALHALDVEIRSQTQILKALEQEAENAYAPLVENIRLAQIGLDGVNERIRQNAKELQALRQHYAGLYQPIDDALYALDQREKAALGPLDAAMREQQLAMDLQADRIDAVAEKYERKLLPFQEELNALKKEEVEIDRQKELGGLGQTVTNLEARLRNARVGGAEAVELQRQLAEAQGTLGRRTKQYGLEDRIGSIEEDRDAALAQENEHIQAMERRLELMGREREAQAFAFAQEREVLTERRALLEREEELRARDLEHRAQELEAERETAQASVDAANAALKAEQDVQAARQAATKQYLLDLQQERSDLAWTYQEEERIKGQQIKLMETTLKATQDSYKGQRDEIQGRIDKLRDEEKADVATAKAAVEGAKAKVDALNKAISEQKFDQKQIDAWNKLAEGYDKAANAVKTLEGEGSPRFKEFALQADAARAKAAELAGTMNTDMPPASTTMTTALDTMLKSGLLPLKDQLDPAKEQSFQWLFDKAWTPDKDGSNERDWGYSFHQMGFAAQQMTGVVDFVLHDNFKRWDALFEKPKKWADDWEDAFERMQNATGGGGGGDDKQPFKETDPFGGTPPLTKNHDPFSRGVTPQTDRTRTQVRVPVAVQHVGTIDQRVYVQLPDGMTELPKTVQGWMPHIRNIRAASRRFEKSGH